jgi:linoleoyl-CoA desaturase
MSAKPITFATTSRDFVSTLNSRVNQYFKEHKIARQANSEMILKTIFMFALYFVPYTLIITETITSTTGLVISVVVMGFGLGGIGLSVMHDANHGSYSKKSWVNTALGYSLNLVGANAFNWKMQHNVLHHSYTNIHEEDEDISPRGVLRFSPETKWKRIHRYQYIYAWLLYGLMTIVWLVSKDFIRIIRYQRNGLAKKQNANIGKERIILIASKCLYIGYIFVLPLLLTDLTWQQVLLGIFIMQYIAGFMLAVIFQPAHVVEGTAYPVPDHERNMETNWAIHQLITTTNFANRSKWFTWYVGGLNFQIEHHLFPNICHVHYSKIAPIVKSTAKEFGLPYKTKKTFLDAIKAHTRHLKALGEKPVQQDG